MLVLGLTGSIGMGKSVTAQLFRDAGVRVFDADAAVHAFYRGDAAEAIEAAFPGTTVDGVVARPALAQLVVDDGTALAKLEAIVHPLVRRRREAFLRQAAAAGERRVVLDIPLLFETGGEGAVDAIIVASAPEAVQKARVLARAGMTAARFDAIVAKQMPDSQKRRRAHFWIDTSRGLASARGQVCAVLRATAAIPGSVFRPAA